MSTANIIVVKEDPHRVGPSHIHLMYKQSQKIINYFVWFFIDLRSMYFYLDFMRGVPNICETKLEGELGTGSKDGTKQSVYLYQANLTERFSHPISPPTIKS